MTRRLFTRTSIIALVSVAAIFAADQPGESEQSEKLIRILEPKDGARIVLDDEESMPARRPVRGDVAGFTRDEIQDFELIVEVSIMTDKWYPQGTALVRSDGTWRIRAAHFGGAVHIIRAVLKDKNNNEIASDKSKVTIVQ